ncbi:hypothetical protein Peur_072913 [Populus x canadensis]
MGNKPHIFLQVDGPLTSLRLGTQLVVVGSSRKAASEILKTHDRELFGRCVPNVPFAKDPKLNGDSIAWTVECTDRWKFFRSRIRNELFLTQQFCERKKKRGVRYAFTYKGTANNYEKITFSSC